MIMSQEDIEKRLKESKIGDEIVLDVRLSDLQKGIKLIRSCRKIIFMVHTTIRVELEIDPHDAFSFDDKYILFSTDDDKSYYKELSIKNDKIDGDNKITLEYDGVRKDLNYSLEIDFGAGNNPWFLFEDIPYSKLV